MLVCDSLAKVDRYVEYCNDLMDAYGMFNGKVRSTCWAAVNIFQYCSDFCWLLTKPARKEIVSNYELKMTGLFYCTN